MMRSIWCLASLAASMAVVTPAAATGGFACEATDREVTFAVNGATARDEGGGIVQADGNIEIKGGPQAQFDRTHIAQYWNDARSFRMIVSVHLTGSESILLQINAAGRGDWTYSGGYTVQAGKIKRSGRVTCDARG